MAFSFLEKGKENKILLYSGGFDSFLQSYLLRPDALIYFDIKGQYSKMEIRNLRRMKHYSPVLIDDSMRIGDFEKWDCYLPFRNVYFILTAFQYAQHVMLGINKHDGAIDKTPFFLGSIEQFIFSMLRAREDYQRYLPNSWDGDNFSVTAPYAHFTKAELLGIALNEGLPIEEVQNIRTCYSPKSKKGCGMCPPCWQKADALLQNSIPIDGVFDVDPTEKIKEDVIVENYLT